mmetsp:Transcript_2556/g.11557  ORF Transcript_2556/g.11557 Transcript_2556/m.11557 type:complete len:350 (+) Transcript_2556:2942-3991(+)
MTLDAKPESVCLLRFSLFAKRARNRARVRPLQEHERLEPRDVFEPEPDNLPPEDVHTAGGVAPFGQRGALDHHTTRARDSESLAIRLAVHNRGPLGEGVPRVERLYGQTTVERVSDAKRGSLEPSAPRERLLKPAPCRRGPETAPLWHRHADELSGSRDVRVVTLKRRQPPAKVPLLKLDKRPRQRSHLHRVESPLLHRSLQENIISCPVHLLLDVRPRRSLSLLHGFNPHLPRAAFILETKDGEVSVPLELFPECGARRGLADGWLRKGRHRGNLDRSLVHDLHLSRALLPGFLRSRLRRGKPLSHRLELATESHDGGVFLPRGTRRVTKSRHIEVEGNHRRVVQLLG